MTAEPQAKPRIKITYATLRNDNEELHAAYEAGLEKAKGRLGAYHRNFDRRARARRRRRRSSCAARSTATRWSGTFAKGTRQDVEGRDRGGPHGAARRGSRWAGSGGWRSSSAPPS